MDFVSGRPLIKNRKQKEYTITIDVRGMGQKMMIANFVVDKEESVIVQTMRRMVIEQKLLCDYPMAYAIVNGVRGLGQNMMIANLAVGEEGIRFVNIMRRMVVEKLLRREEYLSQKNKRHN